jgi:hypothetical protein
MPMRKQSIGRDYVNVICDVCLGKYHSKDVSLITDKHNFQYGQVVCSGCKDEVNEQVFPVTSRERPISSPETLRPPKAVTTIVNANDDRLPSAPREPFCQVNPIDNYVDLFWQGPLDTGSSAILGYKIVRASQLIQVFSTISDNTNSGATYYTDTTSDVDLRYIYKVAAITSFGTGPYSEEFYWPKDTSPLTYTRYLIITPQTKVLIIGSDVLNVTGI